MRASILRSPGLFSEFWLISNAIVWMVSTPPVISKSSSPSINLLVAVPRAPITIGIIVTFMFHSFFISLARSRYLSFFSCSFSFTQWPVGTAKFTARQVLFFLLVMFWSGHLAEIRWSVCISKSYWSLCVSFSWTDSGLCIYHFFVWLNFNFLYNSLPNCVKCYTLTGLICYIHLLCDRSFHLYHHITYICFVASYLVLLWYDWSLWHCFVQLLEEIQFLSKGFPFLATSPFSHVRKCP